MSRDIRIEVEYAFPPERVWQALTDRAVLAQWLMETDFEPVVGRKFQFRTKPMPQWRGIVDCEVLTVEPPHRLAYTWQGDPEMEPTVVTWTLTPVATGTRLCLEHTGFIGAEGEQLAEMLASGWGSMLREKLCAALERLPAPEPSGTGG